jgi:hypothetical protein
MKTIAKIGLITLAAGVTMAGSLPLLAGEQPDYWSVRGLTRPGAWFEKYNTEQPATIGVSKSGRGVGPQKSTAPKVGKDLTRHIRSTNKNSQK